MITQLKRVKFFAYHGLYDFEKVNGGDFIVDVSVISNDRLQYLMVDDVINYEILFSIVQKRMNVPTLFIEEVARLILEDIKQGFPSVLTIEVSIEKCAPPINEMNGSAMVTISYHK
jgi:7,8-dihydroneopterin aldolase/epimerase/oxygenase